MSITILNYLDQKLVDNINAQAIARAEAAKAAQEAAKAQAADTGSDFSAVLDDAVSDASAQDTSTYTGISTASSNTGTGISTQNTSSYADCPENLETIFQTAANTYNVNVNLLKAIAKAESNFNANAVSSAGAIGIMQLMPQTAASLGVSDSYDAQQNIMGGAKYIAQLIQKYSGNLSLALAAYNAGSNNVEKYGGIPPFTETQNYVKKVLAYFEEYAGTSVSGTSQGSTSLSGLSDSTKSELSAAFASLFGSQSAASSAVDVMAALLDLMQSLGSVQSLGGVQSLDGVQSLGVGTGDAQASQGLSAAGTAEGQESASSSALPSFVNTSEASSLANGSQMDASPAESQQPSIEILSITDSIDPGRSQKYGSQDISDLGAL